MCPSTAEPGILGDEESEAADPTLGLYEVDELTPARAPKASKKGRRYTDPVSFRIAEELDDLAERHRNTTCEMVNWQGSTEVLLGDARWLPSPFHRARSAGSRRCRVAIAYSVSPERTTYSSAAGSATPRGTCWYSELVQPAISSTAAA